MRNREELDHQSPRDVPPVGRPRGAVWRSLQADGIVWEGQVLLVGDDVDLASRMIVTHRRLALVRGGDVILEVSRDWLRPEPVLRRDGVLDLFVTTPGSGPFDEPQTIPLRMREGHPAAGHIIAMLAPGGVRRIAPDALSAMERAREVSPPPTFGGFWDDPADDPLPDTHGKSNGSNLIAGPSAEPQKEPAEWAPVEPRDRVVRLPSTPPPPPQTSAYLITGLLPRDQRKSQLGLLLRVGALTLLLATAAAFGAGKLQLPVSGGGSGAILAVPTPTEGVGVAASPTHVAAVLTTDDQSALAIGVGGAAQTPPPADAASTPAAESAAASSPAAVVAAEPAIPTPAPSTPEPVPTAAPAPSPTTAPAPATAPPATAATTETQPAAVSTDTAPAQEIVVGPLRIAFTTALRAETLPDYGLPPGSGDWVLLTAEIANEGEAAASLAMNDFRLFDRTPGTVFDLDPGTDVIASLARFDPARAPGDTIALEPGASTRALFLFLLPPGSSDDLALIVDQSSLDIAPLLALGEATVAEPPALVEANVLEVLDGAQIAVDVGGNREIVQYLGMQGPAGEACFAAEAAAANAALLEGQQVWLERQATDRGGDNVLTRDVWIASPDGGRALVSARLLEAGAAVPSPNAPDTRYQAWLSAAAALAVSNGAGLWTACPDAAPAAAEIAIEDNPRLAFDFGGWRTRWGLSAR